MKCKWHLCENEVPKSNGTRPRFFCNEKCRRKQAVHDKRKRLKLQVLEYLGSRCARCGWDECPDGLAAHHIDPVIKSFGIGGITRSWEKIKMECDKCVLLCHNCHSVVHATKDPKYLVSI